MTRLQVSLTWAVLRRRLARDESGQAVVESAIVIPMMTFLILGMLQLVMMQHARIMTEYAAFNAARAGIVWNADRIIMENAAIISLLPTYEGLLKEADIGNPKQMLKRILERALLYQLHRRIPQAVSLLQSGASAIISKIPIVPSKGKDKLNKNVGGLIAAGGAAAEAAGSSAIGKALGAGDDRMVSVQVMPPLGGAGIGTSIPGMFLPGGGGSGGIVTGFGGAFGGLGNNEIDFDDFANREKTRLSIRVQYLYMMRVPFANWVIHQAWLAGQAGKELYGAVWNAQENVAGETGFRTVASVKNTGGGFLSPITGKLAKLADKGVFMVPLTASYTMRMQSNPYKSSLSAK